MAALIWAIAGVACLLAELLTVSFVLVYFGLGGLAAAAVALLGGPLAIQVLVFAVVALGLLALTRRPLLRHIQPRREATNVHALTGRRGVVTIPISNDENTGQIRIGTETGPRATRTTTPPRSVPASTSRSSRCAASRRACAASTATSCRRRRLATAARRHDAGTPGRRARAAASIIGGVPWQATSARSSRSSPSCSSW